MLLGIWIYNPLICVIRLSPVYLSIVNTVYPKPLCILFSDTKGIQWAYTDATDA